MTEDKSRKELCKSILDKIGIALKKIGSYELFINKKTISEIYVLTISKSFHPYELKISNDDDIEQLLTSDIVAFVQDGKIICRNPCFNRTLEEAIIDLDLMGK